MHRDDCPDRWSVRKDAERDAEYGRHRYNPYDCDEANREYSRQIHYAEEQREQERIEEGDAQRRREAAWEEERQEQEYYRQNEEQQQLDDEAFHQAEMEHFEEPWQQYLTIDMPRFENDGGDLS